MVGVENVVHLLKRDIKFLGTILEDKAEMICRIMF